MFHSISKNNVCLKVRFQKKYAIALICVCALLLPLLVYTAVFMRDTRSLDACLAYPNAQDAQFMRVSNAAAEEKDYSVYLCTQNTDGIQEMYLLKNKRFLPGLDVQRYFVVQHHATVMEDVGFFPMYLPGARQGEPADWYFYSQNNLQMVKLVCDFHANDGAMVTQEFSCDAEEPFVHCVSEMQGQIRLERITGYNQAGEQVYMFNTSI